MPADDFVKLLMFPGHVIQCIGQATVTAAFSHIKKVLLQVHLQPGLFPEEQGLGS